ncbi:MAG: hypothetical protein M3464_06065 [Chloroflexota bacterium]|nr:hypothetical protein [Chloroflexota bacterium]
MSAQVSEAAKRGAIEGAIAAGGAFFAVLAGGGKIEAAGIAAGVAFFGALALRVGEGQFDANRASRGDVIPSDVR